MRANLSPPLRHAPFRQSTPPPALDFPPALAVLAIVAVVALATLSRPSPAGLSFDHPGAVRWIAEGLIIAINAWVS